MPNRDLRRAFFLLTLLLFAIACEPTPQLEPATTVVSAGGTVRYYVEKGRVDPQSLRVTVGDKRARFEVHDDVIEVTLPLTLSGETNVTIFSGDEVLVTSTIAVREAPTRRVVLAVDSLSVQLVESLPSNGSVTTQTSFRGRRLAFEVVNPDGAVIQSGSLPHPIHTGAEIFSPAGDPSAARAHNIDVRDLAPTTVSLYGSTQGCTLRVFDVPAGADLSTVEGRASRALIQEVTL